MSIVETTGVILALLYVVLAMKEHILCWVAAFLSSVCYLYVFFEAELYTESALQIFFIVLAIQGLRRWNSSQAISERAEIQTLSLRGHARGIVLCLLGTGLLGFAVSALTHAPFVYLDAGITVFSIYTTYLVTEKYLENWLYWIGIDVVATALYVSKDLHLTAGLFAVYVILATIGYFEWKKAYLKNDQL